MKVFVAVLLVIVSVSARGSGPYLPSGWKPDGPAFYLPSEIAKPVISSVQETVFEDTEASGSDTLKEYGPPKLEISLNVGQNLPDVVTEQSFLVEVKNQETVAAVEDAGVVESNIATVNTEQVAAIVEEVATATESVVVVGSIQNEDQATESSDVQPTAEVLAVEAVTEVELTTNPVLSEEVKEEVSEKVEEEVKEEAKEVVKEEVVVPTAIIAEEIVVPTAAFEESNIEEIKLQEILPTVVEEVVAEKISQVENIAETIINLEKEVKAIEVQAIEKIAEISSTKESSGFLEQTPEGFLEYGPPGFSEYGPPKEEDLARLSAQVDTNSLENNEVRRRRFSPKFKPRKQ